MDQLMNQGRGAGGSVGRQSDELKTSCRFGFHSYGEWVRNSQSAGPFHEARIMNAVAGAIVQSGNVVDRPLTEAGLDGTGEVIQVML